MTACSRQGRRRRRPCACTETRTRTRVKRHRRAFTTLELLISIAVIGALFAIGITSYLRIQRAAVASKCTTRLQSLGVGLNLYLADNALTMPMWASLRESKRPPTELELPTMDIELEEYINDADAFRCPADHRLWESTGSSYLWNSLVNGQPMGALNFMGLTKNHSGIPLISDKENFHEHVGDGVNILYADGHVQKELQFTVDPK